jgi:arylsulfatase A-like enzyme
MKALRLLPALLAALPACGGGGTGAGAPARTPVVLIVIDTLRADRVFDAQGEVVLPRMAELARDGVAFPRAFAHTSWTLPSHTALFSSRPPRDTGVILNAQRVPADLPLLPEWLAARGYRTEGVVSLCSLIPTGELSRLDRGFEAFDDRMQRVMNPADVALGHARAAVARCAEDPRPFFLFAHFADPHQPYTAHGTVTLPAQVVFGGRAVGEVPNLAGFAPFQGKLELAPGENRLEVRADRPFTVKYAGAEAGGVRCEARFDDVHPASSVEVVLVNPGPAAEFSVELWAWDAPDEAESRRRYGLEVEFIDRHVGLLLDDLRARGLYDKALVILTADHGEGLGQHGLLDHGLNCFDELLHVPLIVKLPAGHPGRAALERSAAGQVRQIDLVPTILQVLDLPALPGSQGLSLLEQGERLLLAETHALAVGDFFALRDERYKLIYFPPTDRFALFDLAADPEELRPQVDVDAERFGPWMERLRAAAQGAPGAAGIDRSVDPETFARLKAMGYF